jgi:molecular chaperone GrpE
MSEDLNPTEAPQNIDNETSVSPEPAAPKNEKKLKKDKQAELQQALAEEKDKFLRLFAEFENYKKRTVKERMDLFKTAGQEVITALLPVVDDFERALKEIAKSEEKELFVGVELISQKLSQVLQSKGLELVEVVPGADFDADIHEAITQIPAPDPSLKGKVVDVVEKGYKLGDRMIRHPKVVVGQ